MHLETGFTFETKNVYTVDLMEKHQLMSRLFGSLEDDQLRYTLGSGFLSEIRDYELSFLTGTDLRVIRLFIGYTNYQFC